MRCKELVKILGIFWEIVWILGGLFWNFFRGFFGGILWEEFFGRIFLGEIFWEDFLEEFFGRNYLVEIEKELMFLSRF